MGSHPDILSELIHLFEFEAAPPGGVIPSLGTVNSQRSAHAANFTLILPNRSIVQHRIPITSSPNVDCPAVTPVVYAWAERAVRVMGASFFCCKAKVGLASLRTYLLREIG